MGALLVVDDVVVCPELAKQMDAVRRRNKIERMIIPSLGKGQHSVKTSVPLSILTSTITVISSLEE